MDNLQENRILYNLSIVLLAAGDSKRFLGNKLLTKINEKPMFYNIVDKILDIPVENKVLVTQYDEIIGYLKMMGKEDQIRVVKNNHSDLGISHSIKLGIYETMSYNSKKSEHLSEPEGFLFAVCDQPWITKDSIERLIYGFFNSSKKIACLSYQGRLGNPVIFHRQYMKELLNLNGDTGGRAVLKKYLKDVEFIEVMEPRELLDIDTRDSLHNLRTDKY